MEAGGLVVVMDEAGLGLRDILLAIFNYVQRCRTIYRYMWYQLYDDGGGGRGGGSSGGGCSCGDTGSCGGFENCWYLEERDLAMGLG